MTKPIKKIILREIKAEMIENRKKYIIGKMKFKQKLLVEKERELELRKKKKYSLIEQHFYPKKGI